MTDETTQPGPANTGDEHSAAAGLLRRALFASFAMIDGDRPYVVVLNFAYEASPAPHGRLVFHTGPGRKSAALAANPRVCVTASAGERFHQGDAPCSDGYAFSSVVAEGTARLLEDRGERLDALRAIMVKYDRALADRPFDERVLAKTLVYEVRIEELGFRQLH
jgi:uncharacterized protein